MKNIFNSHLNEVRETYFQHFLKAFNFGIKLIFIAARAFIHASLPWCYEHSVSEQISKLNDTLQARKNSINSDLN